MVQDFVHDRFEHARGAVHVGEHVFVAHHHAAHARCFFHQKNLTAFLGQEQGCGHAGRTRAHDHCIGVGREFRGFKGLLAQHALQGAVEHGSGFVRGGLIVIRHPGAHLADVGHLHEEWVQPRAAACGPERVLMLPGRARADHHPR